MADIIVAILHFPNDPTKNNSAHQMFLAEQTDNYLNLYSVSSILGKERRVYGPDKNNYVTILTPEHTINGFKSPSFIDCTKMYQITISSSVNISALTQRTISSDLRQRIDNKISEMKAKGTHTVYSITEAEFSAWNPRIRKLTT